MKKRSGGFTLVELLVTVGAASIVAIAVSTVLLLGLRVNHVTMQTAQRRQNARIVMTMVENLASSGVITDVYGSGGNWVIKGADGAPILRWENGRIKTGAGAGGVLLEDVEESAVYVRQSSGKDLLVLTLTVDGTAYRSTVYCRKKILSSDSDVPINTIEEISAKRADSLSDTVRTNRLGFIETLLGQRPNTGSNDGRILSGPGRGMYYSEWYIGSENFNSATGWGPATPWCACFVSWAIDQLGDGALRADAPRFANVDYGMERFQSQSGAGGKYGEYGAWGDPSSYSPLPGDLIFLDWSAGDDPDHVGVVLYTEDGFLYTIEGNSNGRVAVRTYPEGSPQIVGYGILRWTTE